ncbi:uncharacterized protein LOC111203623 [Brassica napus]|nr:PREDICTED: uncharacterized protein LOC106329974 [Brassica oleracea var. oleracea]XP_022553255.1 uncharacterized protein LOC111203623 [Brassica napus]KAF3549175.1 hypothetical protein DY000_02002568 [Brassica cretica]KAG2295872.1 hypothetical protein Bca52824_042541 [Brassica carinata]
MANARLHGNYNSQDTVFQETISDGCDHRVWDCESPLYDSYELVSFAHIIERKLLPFSPLTRPSSVSLRALMDKDKDDYSSVSETTTRCVQRRKKRWNRTKKNDETKEDIKKKKRKISSCILWCKSSYKNLFL